MGIGGKKNWISDVGWLFWARHDKNAFTYAAFPPEMVLIIFINQGGDDLSVGLIRL
jgi:hypothetical protein